MLLLYNNKSDKGGMYFMKKIIATVLTASIVISCATASFAKPNNKSNNNKREKIEQIVNNKDNRENNKKNDKKDNERSSEKVNRVKDNKIKQVEKLKETLNNKCDKLTNQILKLKSYIVSEDGKFLVEFKDQEAGDNALKSIETAMGKIISFKEAIEEAQDFKELKDLRKELQKNFIKHQTIVKRITGLTSTARLRSAYNTTKALVDRLGAGLEEIPSEVAAIIDVDAIKVKYDKISAKLEEAYDDYLEAVEMYSSITDSANTDKSYKDAHNKLKEAKDGIHDALIETKKLLVEIKTSILRAQDDEIEETDIEDIDEVDEEIEDNDIEDEDIDDDDIDDDDEEDDDKED